MAPTTSCVYASSSKGQEQKAFLASQIENLEYQLTDFEKAHAAFFGEATRAQKAQKTSQPLWLLLGSILALLGFFCQAL